MKDWAVNFASFVTGLYHAMSCSENKVLKAIRITYSFIFNIYQLALYRACLSTQHDILYPASSLGVPQGSVLDPNIFL